MIERNFIAQKTKEYYLKKYVKDQLSNVGIANVKLKKIPLGEKIIIYTNKPSLVVGSKGANIKDLTKALKRKFNLENPQLEINEVKEVFLDPQLVAEKIASSLERFGSARFKGVGHKIMTNVINSGAFGVEIIISGKIPSARAKSWRFYMGYLKKCGDVSIAGVRRAQASALLKSGIIGIKVALMPPDVTLPDKVEVLSEPLLVIENVARAAGEKPEESSPKKKTKEKKKTPRKKAPKKEKLVSPESAAAVSTVHPAPALAETITPESMVAAAEAGPELDQGAEGSA